MIEVAEKICNTVMDCLGFLCATAIIIYILHELFKE